MNLGGGIASEHMMDHSDVGVDGAIMQFVEFAVMAIIMLDQSSGMLDPSWRADGVGCAVAVLLFLEFTLRQCSSPTRGSGEAKVETCKIQRHTQREMKEEANRNAEPR